MSLSQALATAYDETFANAMEDPRQLVTIHRRLSQGRGRRTLELSLNRSIVVLTIAAWQAYVEAVAGAILDSLGQPRDDTTSGRTLTVMWNARKSELDRQINQYSTANADNTRRLLQAMGFDPKPSWTWGTGNGQLRPGQVWERLNQWVKVRHSIAHGSQLPEVEVVTVNQSGPTVRLKDAEACIEFIERIAERTNEAAQKLARRAASADATVEADQLQADLLLSQFT